jgi:hypothetical protein
MDTDQESLLLDVVISKLPEPLFTQINARTFSSLDKLLSSIIRLEQGSSHQTHHRFFNEPFSLNPGKKPSTMFAELLSDAKQITPQLSEEVLTVMARCKFESALPPTGKTIMALASKDSSLEDILQILDDTMTTDIAHITVSQVADNTKQDDMACNLEKKLDEIVARISKLEGPRPRYTDQGYHHVQNPSDLCWYHLKFGKLARQCRAPCRYNSNFQKN